MPAPVEQTLVVKGQYNGPPNSGNGGYSCGLFARCHPSYGAKALQVTLRNPVPLDQNLQVQPVASALEVRKGDTLIGVVSETSIDIEPLPAPGLSQAKAAEERFIGFTEHPFPTCFVCGPERTAGDGLRLFTGQVHDNNGTATNTVAASWIPYPALADAQGCLKPEFIWAALDCPTYFGAFIGKPHTPAVLGKQAVFIFRDRLYADVPYILQSWPLSQDGRKHLSAGALYTAGGECVAICRATWVTLGS